MKRSSFFDWDKKPVRFATEPNAFGGSYTVLMALTILLLWLGVYPVPLMNVIRMVLPI
jgi:hypothetical protein